MRPKDHHSHPVGQEKGTPSENLKPCQAQHVMEYELEDELTLYDHQAEVVHILNPTAAAVWQLCDGTLGAEDIAAALAGLYDLKPETVLTDVQNVLVQFHDAGLLQKSVKVANRV